jgi:lipopolysaccharide transport system permease protein
MPAPATSRTRPLRQTAPKPHLVIEPGSAPLLQYGRDLWHHRDLIRVLALRDIKLRYRQTALGASWVILQPLLSAGILGFVFGKVAKLPTDGIPFFIFSYAGLLAWSSFSNSLMRTTSSMISNASLVAKIFFPRLVLPLSTIVAIVLDFSVALVVLMIMLFTNDLVPGAPILLLPVWLLLGVMLAQGIGSFLAAMAVRWRDIPQVTPVLLQLFLYASPVAYAVSAVPERYLTVYYLNPLAGMLEAFRWSLLGTPAPTLGHLLYFIVVSVVLFIVGFISLEKLERKFADVI